jgi:hypothetical protein
MNHYNDSNLLKWTDDRLDVLQNLEFSVAFIDPFLP